MAEDVASRLLRFRSVSASFLMPFLARAKAVACPIPGVGLESEGFDFGALEGFGKVG
jgi:hypothetical protein